MAKPLTGSPAGVARQRGMRAAQFDRSGCATTGRKIMAFAVPDDSR